MSKRKQIELSIDKIEEQEKYIESIHMMNEGLFNRTGNRKSYFCTTFGCPVVAEVTIFYYPLNSHD